MSRHFDRTSKQQPQSSSSAKNTTARNQHPALVIQRAQINPSSLTPSDVLTLQRSIGNQATVRLLSPILQTKLKLGPAGDKYEQEADQVAQQVVQQSDQTGQDVQRSSMEEEEIQAKPISESISHLQRAPLEEEELQMKRESASNHVQRYGGIEEEELQMKRMHGSEAGEVKSSVAQQIQTARGGGQPLDAKVRRQMERGFGANFKGVRVHTDQQADTLNRSLNARAFTVGNDLFFRSGEYKPGSGSGKQLLAHELTHTIQQGGSQPEIAQPARSQGIIQRNGTGTVPMGIRTFIASPLGYEAYYNFAKSRYEHYELECWKMIQKYRGKPRRSVAINIFDTYVSLNAPQQINIPESMVRNLKGTIDNYRDQKGKQNKLNKGFRKLQSIFTGQAGDPTLFDNLQEELIRAMTDSFAQFQLTNAYTVYSEEINRRNQQAQAMTDMLKQNNML